MDRMEADTQAGMVLVCKPVCMVLAHMASAGKVLADMVLDSNPLSVADMLAAVPNVRALQRPRSGVRLLLLRVDFS